MVVFGPVMPPPFQESPVELGCPHCQGNASTHSPFPAWENQKEPPEPVPTPLVLPWEEASPGAVPGRNPLLIPASALLIVLAHLTEREFWSFPASERSLQVAASSADGGTPRKATVVVPWASSL